MSSLEPKTPEESPMRRALLLVSGIAFLVIAAGLLYLGQGLLSGKPSDRGPALESIPAFSATTVSGVGVVGMDSHIPEVGDAAPDFTLLDLDGNKVTLSELRGRPVILNFWATWCGPCRLEMPELQEAQAAYQDQDLVILTVNQAESAERVHSFFDELGLDMMAVLDSDGVVARAYGAYLLPSSLFIDVDGNVSAFHRGILSRAQIDEYLALTLSQS